MLFVRNHPELSDYFMPRMKQGGQFVSTISKLVFIRFYCEHAIFDEHVESNPARLRRGEFARSGHLCRESTRHLYESLGCCRHRLMSSTANVTPAGAKVEAGGAVCQRHERCESTRITHVHQATPCAAGGWRDTELRGRSAKQFFPHLHERLALSGTIGVGCGLAGLASFELPPYEHRYSDSQTDNHCNNHPLHCGSPKGGCNPTG